MFCENCGAPLPENETKCPACGAVNTSEPELAQEYESAVGGKDEPRGFSNKRNVIIIAIAAAVLLAGGVGAAIGINAYNNSSENIISVAQRYLDEKNYEQAIIEFKRVLELDPTNIDAYLGLAEAYVATGDIDSAIDILRKGVEVTGDSRLQNMLDELLKSLQEPAQTTAATTIATTTTTVMTTTTLPVEETIEPTEEAVEGWIVYNDPECLEIEQMISAYLRGEGEIDESRLEKVTSLKIYGYDGVGIKCGRYWGTEYPNYFDKGRITNLANDIPFIFNMPKLTELRLSEQPLSDISPLSSLTNLTILHFYYCYNITDLTPLSSLTNLTELHLESCDNITDLTPLSSLTNLTSLDLSDCDNITDLTPLSSLTNLTELDLRGCDNITDLTPLSSLTNLTTLDVCFCYSLPKSEIDDFISKHPDCSVSY